LNLDMGAATVARSYDRWDKSSPNRGRADRRVVALPWLVGELGSSRRSHGRQEGVILGSPAMNHTA
jgi:hypothetical protein